ncbi:MAG: tyrosine-type recombinase/integrase [Planctomycetaceae bacterium]
MAKRNRVPKYALHRATGQARVRIQGKDHYLGEYNSPESKQRYRVLIEQWKLQQRAFEYPEMSVGELALLYLEHAQSYYVKDGQVTSEVSCIKAALRPLIRLFRNCLVSEFSPSKLRRTRDEFISSGVTRYTINKNIGRIVRMFGWAVSMEYSPPHIVAALREVDGLKAGRTTAPESDPVKPVSLSDVDAIRLCLAEPLWGAIQFQLATACRPGEALSLRMCDVNRTGDVWTYCPEQHKTQHHGKKRTILIGPMAQQVLDDFDTEDDTAFVFAVPNTEGRSAYRRHSYTVAVRRACKKAGIPVWRPNQLRHTAATAIRRAADLETAKTILGHSEIRITEIYAERDLDKARQVIAQIG